MKVEVHLFATLARYLPSGSQGGVTVLDLPPDSTVRDAAARLGIPADLDRVALINGREADPGAVLQPGDVVTLFPPLAGGRLPAARVA